MPYFRTSGGSFLEIDLPDPRNVHAVERHEYYIATGEIVEVPADSVEWVEADGAKKLQLKAPVGAPEQDERDALLVQADALGIVVDRRWGAARLAAAIAEADTSKE